MQRSSGITETSSALASRLATPIATPRSSHLMSDLLWSGSALLRHGSEWPWSSFSRRLLQLAGAELSWSTLQAPTSIKGQATASSFVLRSTAAHPYGLSIAVEGGASVVDVCVQSQADLVALAAALRKGGAQERQAEGSTLLPSWIARSDEAGPSGAAPAVADDGKWRKKLSLRPAPEGTKTLVELNYFILALSDIVKGGEQTFSVDFYLDMHWTDERLIGESEDEVEWDEVWKPGIEITNSIEAKTEFENFLLDDETGRVTYQTRYRAKLIASFMNLRAFPFDAQVLNISFESGAHAADEVELQMLRTAGSNVASRLVQEGGLAEWGFASLREVERVNTLEFDDSQYSNLEVQVVVRRHSGYYVKKIMLTVLLIVGMSWSVLWIDPTEVADRIAISTTLGLTAIAFNFVVNDALPKIPYFTSMDYYLTLSFFAIVFTVLENVVSFYISQGGVGHDAAAAMAAAKDLDFISFVASAGVMALLTAWFLSHLLWEKCADTNKDGIVDAAEVIAYQERVFGGKGVGGEGVVVDQRRRQGWSMSSPARLVHEAGDNPVLIV